MSRSRLLSRSRPLAPPMQSLDPTPEKCFNLMRCSNTFHQGFRASEGQKWMPALLSKMGVENQLFKGHSPPSRCLLKGALTFFEGGNLISPTPHCSAAPSNSIFVCGLWNPLKIPTRMPRKLKGMLCRGAFCWVIAVSFLVFLQNQKERETLQKRHPYHNSPFQYKQTAKKVFGVNFKQGSFGASVSLTHEKRTTTKTKQNKKKKNVLPKKVARLMPRAARGHSLWRKRLAGGFGHACGYLGGGAAGLQPLVDLGASVPLVL